jgi:hypothetical protein
MIKDSKLPEDEILGEKGSITTKGVGQAEPHQLDGDQPKESTNKRPEPTKEKPKSTGVEENSHETEEKPAHEANEKPVQETEDLIQPNENEKDAVELAKRAILSVNSSDYSPIERSKKQLEAPVLLLNSAKTGHTELFSYLASSATTMLMGLITHELSKDTPSITEQNHLIRRAPEENSHEEEGSAMTVIEMSFVYKTFLIFGGLLLIMNSLIKSLNTKLTGDYAHSHSTIKAFYLLITRCLR